MKNLIVLCVIALLIVSCKSKTFSKNDAIPINIHQVIAKQAINTSSYTYVLVTESGLETWLAVPKTDIKIGETYYYQGGMQMEKFESKELKRTFETVLFLEAITNDKDKLEATPSSATHEQKSNETHLNVNRSNLEKIQVSIKPAAGGITILELYAKKEFYSGKKVKITGQVTKFSPEIMNTNWVHIQDGTENAGKFDLTLTTAATAAAGETITVEGKVTINKDFGYGYAYEVLLEDAVIVK